MPSHVDYVYTGTTQVAAKLRTFVILTHTLDHVITAENLNKAVAEHTFCLTRLS